jgi:hypothetical protein
VTGLHSVAILYLLTLMFILIKRYAQLHLSHGSKVRSDAQPRTPRQVCTEHSLYAHSVQRCSPTMLSFGFLRMHVRTGSKVLDCVNKRFLASYQHYRDAAVQHCYRQSRLRIVRNGLRAKTLYSCKCAYLQHNNSRPPPVNTRQ